MPVPMVKEAYSIIKAIYCAQATHGLRGLRIPITIVKEACSSSKRGLLRTGNTWFAGVTWWKCCYGVALFAFVIRFARSLSIVYELGLLVCVCVCVCVCFAWPVCIDAAMRCDARLAPQIVDAVQCDGCCNAVQCNGCCNAMQ